MKSAMILLLVVSFVTVFSCPCVSFGEETTQVVWNIDNLESIGGNKTTVEGSPEVIDTPEGKAVQFDGVDDALFVDVHPLAGAKEFTIEIIFRVDADGPPAPRIFHLQENDTANRLMFEVRVTKDGMWYLDTVLRSDAGSQVLINDALTHPCGEWHNAALVFDGTEMRNYVNGEKEMT